MQGAIAQTSSPSEAAGIHVGAQQMLIDGAWCDASCGGTLPIVNPATEQEIGTFPDAGADDVERAVWVARAAFAEGSGEWPSKPTAERLEVLGRVLDALAADAQRIGAVASANGGFTIRSGVGFHAMGAPPFIRQAISQAPAGELAGLPLGELPSTSANYLRREPVGVVLAIPPSNAGYFLGLYKVMAALATGNCVIMKPSPLEVLSPLEIAKAIAAEPEIPAGVFQLVLGGDEAAAALTAHSGVDKISFTGSSATASKIMAAAAPNLSRLTFELGGKSPVIVCDDADLDIAVDGIVWGFTNQTGQACTSGTRVLVSDALHDELVERLAARMERLVVGDPMSPESDIGPVITAAHRDRIEGFVADAVAAGAKLVTGGQRPDVKPGFYVVPTLLDEVTNDMEVAREEIFGPVVAVIRYSDLDDAVVIANDSTYGLAATVWSRDLPTALGLAKRLRAGTVWVNEHHVVSPIAPFGGYKRSGFGREFGVDGLLEFTEVKHVHVDLTQRGQRPLHGIVLGH